MAGKNHIQGQTLCSAFAGGADAGSGPEIPPREGRTHTPVVLDHLLVRQAFDMYGLGQFLTLGRVPQPYFKTEETEAQRS